MGDCGAFTYKDEGEPPYGPEEVVDFYSTCDFDFGMSVDHVILAYQPDREDSLFNYNEVAAAVMHRQELTLELAAEFLRLHRTQKCRFMPIGVAQGWSPASYAYAADELQSMGYSYIALGGMVRLKTSEILACLETVNAVRRPATKIHLLGVTRCAHIPRFRRFGVVSFDSTSPFLQAFKDGTDNYHTLERSYTAIRIPQVEGNAKLRRRIGAGAVSQDDARSLERQCLRAIREFDRGALGVDDVVGLLASYDRIHGGKTDYSPRYRSVLRDQPWKKCNCDICKAVGVEVIIFRGTERNKRRGFHNLTVFYHRLHHELRSRRRHAAGCAG